MPMIAIELGSGTATADAKPSTWTMSNDIDDPEALNVKFNEFVLLGSVQLAK